jgi:hypothetical protein
MMRMPRIPRQVTSKRTRTANSDVPPRSIEQLSFVGSRWAAADRKDRTSERHHAAVASAFAARAIKKK